MKGIFLSFIFFTFISSSKAQTELFGKYIFNTENGTTGALTLSCHYTFLIKDTIVISKDSSVTSIVKGTWKIKKTKTLELVVNEIISLAEPFGNLKKLRYSIKNGQLYLVIPNKKKYLRQNKKLDRKFPTSASGTWDDYDVFKAKQNKRYFQRVDIFHCK